MKIYNVTPIDGIKWNRSRMEFSGKNAKRRAEAELRHYREAFPYAEYVIKVRESDLESDNHK